MTPVSAIRLMASSWVLLLMLGGRGEKRLGRRETGVSVEGYGGDL